MTQPDRIVLGGLGVECIIGFIEWERRVKQTVLIDLELPVNCRRAAGSDEVADTLDYQQVATRVTAFVAQSQFKLLETLAERIAALIFDEFRVEWVHVAVKKTASMPGLRDATVSIERTATER